MASDVLLVPGFGGTAQQPLLQKLIRALAEHQVSAEAVTLRKGRPAPDLAAETAELTELWLQRTGGRGALIGRSFGARVAVRVALSQPVPRLALLGFPIRPPGKRRALDEQALLQLPCPTLILQGESDELGPPEVLRTFLSPTATLEIVPKAKHSYPAAAERLVIERCAAWFTTSD